MFLLSLPMRGAWIEIFELDDSKIAKCTSLPMRGAWIEMLLALRFSSCISVAPHAGSVD